MYLADTNLLIESGRSRPHPRVRAWLQHIPACRMFLCPVVLAEFLTGVLRLPPGERQPLVAFLRGVRRRWSWIPLDGRAAVAYAWLRAAQKAKPRVNDLWLAALARSRGLMIATRNTRDFAGWDVRLVDPWSEHPPAQDGAAV